MAQVAKACCKNVGGFGARYREKKLLKNDRSPLGRSLKEETRGIVYPGI